MSTHTHRLEHTHVYIQMHTNEFFCLLNYCCQNAVSVVHVCVCAHACISVHIKMVFANNQMYSCKYAQIHMYVYIKSHKVHFNISIRKTNLSIYLSMHNAQKFTFIVKHGSMQKQQKRKFSTLTYARPRASSTAFVTTLPTFVPAKLTLLVNICWDRYARNFSLSVCPFSANIVLRNLVS